MSDYYRNSSNSSTLPATAAIPDRDDDEWSCCSFHTFAATTATTAVVEVPLVTIGYSAH